MRFGGPDTHETHGRILHILHCIQLGISLAGFVSIVTGHQVQIFVEHAFLSLMRIILLR